ncbi:MAG: hypothetical protein K0Q78_2285, partial [Cellvibrio sp.]|nr:hypothetical protein [Cellvibrio sp.]
QAQEARFGHQLLKVECAFSIGCIDVHGSFRLCGIWLDSIEKRASEQPNFLVLWALKQYDARLFDNFDFY